MDAACCLKQTNNAKHVKVRVFEAEVAVAKLVKVTADFLVRLAMDLVLVHHATRLVRVCAIRVLARGLELFLILRIVQPVVEKGNVDVACVTEPVRATTGRFAELAMELDCG